MPVVGQVIVASNDIDDVDGMSTIDVLVIYPQPAEQQMQNMINWGRNYGETELGPFLDRIFEKTTEIYRDSGINSESTITGATFNAQRRSVNDPQVKATHH